MFNCESNPSICEPYVTNQIGGFVIQTDNIPLGVCRAKNFLELEAFGMEMLGAKFQKKHNYTKFLAECDATFPTLLGNELTVDTLEPEIGQGLTLVL